MTAVKKNTHGGARPGAGRKPRDPETLKRQMGFRLSPDVSMFLRKFGNMSAAVDDLIRCSHSYQTWKRDQDS